MCGVDLHEGLVLLHDVVGWFVCQRSHDGLRTELRNLFAGWFDVLREQSVLFAGVQRERHVRNAVPRQRRDVHERHGLLLGPVQQQHLRRTDLLPRRQTLQGRH